MLESGVERALLSAGAEVLSGLLRDDPAVATVPAGGKVLNRSGFGRDLRCWL